MSRYTKHIDSFERNETPHNYMAQHRPEGRKKAGKATRQTFQDKRSEKKFARLYGSEAGEPKK